MKNSDLIFKGVAHRVTSPFGMRKHPITGKMKPHNGVDYGTSIKNPPIYAIADGVVRVSKYDKVVGYYISIGHIINGQEYRTVYKHMHKLSHLKPGNKIKKGDLVGYLGASGAVTGPHLHFDFIKIVNGKAVYLDFEEVDLMNTEQVHIMKSGDTLASIGRLYNIDWKIIQKYNNIEDKKIKDLKIGTPIKIPKLDDLSDFKDLGYNDTIKGIKDELDALNKEISVYKDNVSIKDKVILELKDEIDVLKSKITNIQKIVN